MKPAFQDEIFKVRINLGLSDTPNSQKEFHNKLSKPILKKASYLTSMITIQGK